MAEPGATIGPTSVPCPQCGCRRSEVKDSRFSPIDGGGTRRRRNCKECGSRFSTMEVLLTDLTVSPNTRIHHARVKVMDIINYMSHKELRAVLIALRAFGYDRR